MGGYALRGGSDRAAYQNRMDTPGDHRQGCFAFRLWRYRSLSELCDYTSLKPSEVKFYSDTGAR